MPWLACKPFGDIHSICPQANTPILVVLMFLNIFMYYFVFIDFRVNIGYSYYSHETRIRQSAML